MLTILFLLNSNQKRYNKLIDKIHDDYLKNLSTSYYSCRYIETYVELFKCSRGENKTTLKKLGGIRSDTR